MEKFSPLGATQLFVAQAIIGLNIVLVKALLPQCPVFLLLLGRFFCGLIIGLLFNLKHNHTLLKKRDGNPLTNVDHAFLLSQAVTAGFLFNIFIVVGIQYTSAATAGLISSIIPAAIAGLSVIFLKESMNATRLISILLAVVGLIILNIHSLSVGFNHHDLLGQFIVLLSVFPEAIFTIIAKMHRTGISTMNKVIYMNFYNFIIFIPLGGWYLLSHPLPHLDIADYAGILLYGANSVLFFVLWYKGLEKTSALVSGLYTAIAPCSTIVLAYFCLGETIRMEYIITFVLIVFSIILGSGLLTRKPFISIF